MSTIIASLMFPCLFALIFLGVPIAFSLILVSCVAGWFVFGPVFMQQLYNGVYSAATNFTLASIPLFILMGAILERAGIAARLFEAMNLWLGRLPGGLALATIAMGGVFAAASGVVGAVEIVIGLMAIPIMQRYRYSHDLIAGTICASGSLGTIIPPTVIAVVYASLAQLSIGALFAAVMLPGLLMIFLFITYILIRCWLKPEDGSTAWTEDTKLSLGKKLKVTLTALLPAALLIIAVLGSLLAGIASPTEAAAVGALGAFALSVIYGEMTFDAMRQALSVTVRISAMILLIVAGGLMFTGIFAASGGGRLVMQLASLFGDGQAGIIICFLLITFLLGFVLDWTSIVLICVPIFTPVIRASGIDPVWFATLFLVTIQTSYLTPPMASSIFYLKAIAPPDITYAQMCRGVVPFIVVQIITLLCVAAFPALATWLPEQIVGF